MIAMISYHKNDNPNGLTLSKKVYFDCKEFSPNYFVQYIKDILMNESSEVKIKLIDKDKIKEPDLKYDLQP